MVSVTVGIFAVWVLCAACAAQRIAIVQYAEPTFLANRDGLDETYQGFGVMAAYAYAKRHNYTYIQVRDHKQFDGDHYWIKPNAVYSVMSTNQYDYVVIIDADAIFMKPHIPLTDLMLRWGFGKPEHVAAAAYDPVYWGPPPYNNSFYDYKGERRLLLNTGFMIWSTTKRALEAAERWSSCLDRKDPVCVDFAHKWAHEMAAFNRIIRVDMLRPEELVHISCDDALGFDGDFLGVDNNNCKGTYVSHFSNAKDRFHVKYRYMLATELMQLALHEIDSKHVSHINEKQEERRRRLAMAMP